MDQITVCIRDTLYWFDMLALGPALSSLQFIFNLKQILVIDKKWDVY